MRQILLPLESYPDHSCGVIPPRLGRALYHNVLVIGGTLLLAAALLLGALVVNGVPARAQTAGEAPPAGLFFRSGEADSVLEAPVLKTDVDIQVNGMVARARVTQVFHNPSDRWLEGIYVFPLPERSAVDRLTMTVGARRIEGRILEKAEAERTYREAADNGQRASLVSGERPNVFVTSVANIGPGEEITVEIGFQDAVAYENGAFALRFPMVVAPRYLPAPAPEMVEAPAGPAPRAAPVSVIPEDGQDRDLFGPVHTDGKKHNLLALTVHLDAGLPLAGLKSLYHPVVIESDGNGRQTITLSAGEVPADRDFVLEWAPKASQAPQAAVFAEQVGGDAHLLVMMVPPARRSDDVVRPEPRPEPLPRELVFVIDTSGSMHGDSLDQAKAAVVAALKRLRPEDRFNVIQFNSETFALFPRPVIANVANVAKAWHYVSALEAEGGTEMRPALQLALDGGPAQGYLQQVVFLTDGAIGYEEELFGELNANLGQHRLFTVGIGSAPNSYFMRKAAELGRGSFTHIGDLTEVKDRMDKLLARLEQPTPLPDLYAGEPVTFAVRLQGVDLSELDGQLLITGTSIEGDWQQRLALDGMTAAPGVAAVWARAKLAQIEDGLYRPGSDKAAVRAEALSVALEHKLVTRYTSLVAVDETVARPEETPLDRQEVARDLPAGWDAGKVFGSQGAQPSPAAAAGSQAPLELRSRALPAPYLQDASANGRAITLPQTATAAERMAILGGVYLLLALLLILLVLRRRRGTARPGSGLRG